MNLLSRARQNLNLTPAERAFLRLLEVNLIGAAVAAGQVVAPNLNDAALANPSTIAWGSILHTFGAVFFASLILAGRKYLAARADPALPIGTVQVTTNSAGSIAVTTASVNNTPIPTTSADPAFPPGVPLETLTSQLAPAQ